jgi:hypothetical protein
MSETKAAFQPPEFDAARMRADVDFALAFIRDRRRHLSALTEMDDHEHQLDDELDEVHLERINAMGDIADAFRILDECLASGAALPDAWRRES